MHSNNISEIKENCYGCFSCFNICPNNAVEMVENNEGFKYPAVNENCTNCGLCKRVCPHLANKFENKENPECFAFMASDNIRLKSSSGGVFPVLAKYFIEHNGYVAGAVFEKDLSIKHIISNNLSDIEEMLGSKYFQCNIDNCYKETKKILEEGKLVLFTGTPCQIAGLKAFLQKDYENLYCVDIICHGVPSPKVFRKYIQEKLKDKDEKWLHTNFRDKINGIWSKLSITTKTTNTTTTSLAKNDTFMRAFLSNLCLRSTCSNCKFQTIPRQGDLTMGDFWKIWNYDKNMNDEKGTSVVLSNNSKGDFLINILKENAKIFVPVPLENAIKGNPCLKRSAIQNKDRKLFFNLLDNISLKSNIDICLNDKVDYLIVNFWDSYFNYGALLTAYAMQELVKSFGYIPKLLNLRERMKKQKFKNTFMEDFINKYLSITKDSDYTQCAYLAKNAKGVILGSDQVLRLEYTYKLLHTYLLNFVDNSTRKIAISPSFGVDIKGYSASSHYTRENIKSIKNALNSFDYLSCREISGRQIYKDIYDLDSDWIIDPVFLIDKEKYNELIKNSTVDNSGKIASYILDKNDDYNKLYEYISSKEQTDIIKLKDENYLVEDWLSSIKSCKLLITDSFHGVCFALIFNKPFICIRNKKRGESRFDTLIEAFNIKNNFVYSIDEVFNNDFTYNINYETINKKIEEKVFSDIEILGKVLNKNYSNNPKAQKNKIKNKKYLEYINLINPIKHFKLKINYYKCKLLANITIGKKKQHYIDKKHSLKKKLKTTITKL